MSGGRTPGAGPGASVIAVAVAAVTALTGGVVGGFAISHRRAPVAAGGPRATIDRERVVPAVEEAAESVHSSLPAAASTPPPPPPPPSSLAPAAPPVPLPSTLRIGSLARTGRGVVVRVLGGVSGSSATVETPCGSPAAVDGLAPVGAVDVVLDPGHGGSEGGAVGFPSDGTPKVEEATINLGVAREAQAVLNAAGITTVLTRSSDYRLPLDVRGDIAGAAHPKAFVSIHHNAEPDGPHDGPGTETYYQVASGSSRRLAGLIEQEVVRALTMYAVAWSGDTDAGAKTRTSSSGKDYYGVLRRTAGIPAVIAELAFVSSPPEAALLARSDVRRAEGQAVARAIVRFLRTPDEGGPFTTAYPRTEPAGSGGGSSGCINPQLT